MRRPAIALLAFLPATAALSAPAAAATGLTATFGRTGATGTFVVANPTTAAVSGWSIKFDCPPASPSAARSTPPPPRPARG
ncbi:hypothetical protein [Saccharothrix texasensis]|uniref:Cellulose binding domain-containing protein n=1 Tax=Saccharothrix texasensis TaxID=103734 RepID=A0A3N1HAX3_9PSEU|nr:hypothetical protein [Saccharothrix texasensis]ROP39621.1 hypothetical protein EDD40_5012 [Saccharothrix texasensis]